MQPHNPRVFGRTAEERFLAKLTPPDDEGCRLWTAAIQTGGYGSFGFEGKIVKAHRWAYEHWVGPIPPDRDIDHVCHNRSGCAGGSECKHRRCQTIEHLEAVPHRVNMLRSPVAVRALTTASESSAARTMCKRGHPYTAANTYRVPKTGRRACKQCKLASNRSWRNRQNEAP